MAKRNRKRTWYPCITVELLPGDLDYVKGARWRVHDFDNDVMYFMDKERMIDVLKVHDMLSVLPARMEELRSKKERTVEA
jgi:hypothetical protein